MRWYLSAAMVVAGLATQAGVLPARALVVAPPPGPARVAQADGIVVGRVVAHEPKDILLTTAPGVDTKIKYRVAVVNVADTIKGEKAKSVRVAFMPPPERNADPNRPIISGGFRGPQLAMGIEGMFFLTKHHSEKGLYIAQNYYDVVQSANNQNFEKEVKEAKAVMKLLENPLKSLKSENPQDRFQTAAMLIAQYRNFRFGNAKTEPIAAEESKLILKALLDGKWNQGGGRFGEADSWMLFNQLGLTDKDGWKQPQNVNNISQFHDAAKEWLKKNADSYRIQRVVPGAAPNRGGAGTSSGAVEPGVIRIELPVEQKKK